MNNKILEKIKQDFVDIDKNQKVIFQKSLNLRKIQLFKDTSTY